MPAAPRGGAPLVTSKYGPNILATGAGGQRQDPAYHPGQRRKRDGRWSSPLSISVHLGGTRSLASAGKRLALSRDRSSALSTNSAQCCS
jgi:hypothetical protein